MNLDGRQRMIAIVAILAAALMISSYVFIFSSDAEGYEGATDALGNTLTFDTMPETIISTAPSITETLYAMGLGDNIVAVSDNCDYPAEVNKRVADGDLKRIGSYHQPNKEMVVELNADVIFVTHTSGGQNFYGDMKAYGQPVVILHQASTLNYVYSNFNIIGTTMQNQDIAQDLIDLMKTSAEEVQNKSSQGVNPRVMLNLGFDWGYNAPYVFGKATFGNEIITLANASNVAPGDGFFMMTKEYLAMTSWDGSTPYNPDVIIALVQGGVQPNQTYYDNHMDELRNDPIWGATNAVLNDNVYFWYDRPASALQREGPSLIEASKLVLMYTQPELFEGFVPPLWVGDNYSDLIEEHW